MDIPLKTVILLTLGVLVNSASSDPSQKQDLLDNVKNQKISDVSLIRKTTTLNITICIPPAVTDNTKLSSFNVNDMTSNRITFTVQAQRSGVNASCNDTSAKKPCKTSPEEPELTVMLFKKVGSEDVLVCSTNITDENVHVLIDAEGRKIDVHSDKKKGAQNLANLTISLVASSIGNTGFNKTSSAVVILADVTQTLLPTTTIASTTVPTEGRVTSQKTIHTSDKTSHTSESTETTAFHSSKEKVVHSSKGHHPHPKSTISTTTSMGESSLCRGPLSGLVLLVLLPVLFYN